MIYNWPKDWLQGFKRTFASGVTDYLPDPTWADPSRRKTPVQMEQEIRAKKEGVDFPINGKTKLP